MGSRGGPRGQEQDMETLDDMVERIGDLNVRRFAADPTNNGDYVAVCIVAVLRSSGSLTAAVDSLHAAAIRLTEAANSLDRFLDEQVAAFEAANDIDADGYADTPEYAD